MIIPDKHIDIRRSLLGTGGIILHLLENNDTVTSLWEKAKTHHEICNYETFILTMDFLYVIGTVDMVEGMISRGGG